MDYPPLLTINLPIGNSIFSNFSEGNVKVQAMWAIERFLFDSTGNYSSVLWATACYAEGMAKNMTTFLNDLQSLSPEAAAAKLAQNMGSVITTSGRSGTMKSLVNNEKANEQTGVSASAFLDAYNATISALSGSSSISDAQKAINTAMDAIQNFANSSTQNKTDYENSINAIQAAYNYTEQNGNSGNNSSFSSQHENIKSAFTGALNGTSYASNGTKMANLTAALSSLENALNAYEDTKK
jgi:hypothetical protein